MKRILITVITGALLVGTTALAADKVDARMANQQKRIGQGLESGQLTAKEGAQLENKEAALRKEIHNDRQANGGKLTGAEKKQINNQQNKLSNQIYNKKHNAAHR